MRTAFIFIWLNALSSAAVAAFDVSGMMPSTSASSSDGVHVMGGRTAVGNDERGACEGAATAGVEGARFAVGAGLDNDALRLCDGVDFFLLLVITCD
jgi:hypothetical protein